jgi:hypothetical protein
MPMLIAGTVLAASAYALSRAATKVRQVRVAAQHDAPPYVPSVERRKRAEPPDPLTLDLSDLFNVRDTEAGGESGPRSVQLAADDERSTAEDGSERTAD